MGEERTKAETIDFLGNILSSRGPGWREENIVDHSHYNEPIEDRENGDPKGDSRKWCQTNANFSPKALLAKIRRHKSRAIAQLNFAVNS